MNPADLLFPPLFRGEVAPAGVDPFAQAVVAATLGTDPGLVVHNRGGESLRAALVLAPETDLEHAMAMVVAVGLGFSDALGALAPPEVGVHLEWPGGVRVNGASAGLIRAAAATRDPTAQPDWLVTGIEIAITLPEGSSPGDIPERTALHEEGCVEVDPFQLLESWSKHTLLWINHWLDEGMQRLHTEWRSKAHGLGETATVAVDGTPQSGLFVGLDENGGMLLRQDTGTLLIPLSSMLEG